MKTTTLVVRDGGRVEGGEGGEGRVAKYSMVESYDST